MGRSGTLRPSVALDRHFQLALYEMDPSGKNIKDLGNVPSGVPD